MFGRAAIRLGIGPHSSLQFPIPIQVCFPCISQTVDHAQPATPTVTVTDTLVVLIIVMIPTYTV